ncbi:hypothetical protein POM88_021201 [Heracleum sosnowskyi]|uniref:Transposase n=1 Tax=Heracleum sosnowskyi TaxID=360622 RepID=A0AAD8IDF4_9APIA|nr:hypothetical protein POM88_021201 [Heracleum sosnowskyi]
MFDTKNEITNDGSISDNDSDYFSETESSEDDCSSFGNSSDEELNECRQSQKVFKEQLASEKFRDVSSHESSFESDELRSIDSSSEDEITRKGFIGDSLVKNKRRRREKLFKQGHDKEGTIKFETDDLNIGDGYGFTIISDQQKGLENAMKDFMPYAEHRFCTRHLYSNFRKKFPSAFLRKTFWLAATATHSVQHQKAMNMIAKHSRSAYDQLRNLDAKVWTKAHFATTSKADNVENNMSECFNAWIITERYMPPGIGMPHGMELGLMLLNKVVCGGTGHRKNKCPNPTPAKESSKDKGKTKETAPIVTEPTNKPKRTYKPKRKACTPWRTKTTSSQASDLTTKRSMNGEKCTTREGNGEDLNQDF